MQQSPGINNSMNGGMRPPFAGKISSYVPNANSKVGKRSFLVYKRNKYLMVPTDTIAFFYIKFNLPVIVCFDKQEYSVTYSLDHIQQLLAELQFFRINRQYLVNVSAVAEVEHYFA